MRTFYTKRILMNEADGGSGNGAQLAAPAPAPTAAPTAPEQPPAVTIDQVKGLMTEMLGGFKNAVFADLRKSGALKKDETPQPQPAAAPASTGLTAAEVQQMIDRRDAVTRAEVELKLKPETVKRMRAMVEAEKPDDPGAWVSSFVTDMGLVRATETATQAPAPAPVAVPSAAPVSDKGSPAPGGVVGWRLELATNPINMSVAARQQMNAELGEEKARKQRLEASRGQAERMKVIWKKG